MQNVNERELTVIEQIHNDFYGAEERLLQEAKRIIADPDIKTAVLSERANKLGFGNSKPGRAAMILAEQEREARETSKAIEYFHKHYPFNKFITEKEVLALCQKWNLVLGDAENFIGDIPEKNIYEMENFKLRKEDFETTDQFTRQDIEKKKFADYIREEIIASAFLPEIGIDRGTMGGFGVMDFRNEILIRIRVNRLPQMMFDAGRTEIKRKAPFKIVAPQKDFNMDGHVLNGFKIEKEAPQVTFFPDDPIVLQPVKGGYLIVTAWGPEASDPAVVNSINN